MIGRRRAALCLCFMMISAMMTACGNSSPSAAETSAADVQVTDQEGTSVSSDAPAQTEAIPENKAVSLNFRFADAEEAEQRLLAQTEYLGGLTQNDLNYRVGKNDATLEEFKGIIRDNVLTFTDEEKAAVTERMNRLAERLGEMGFVYDIPEEIVLLKTTMHEEGDAGAYTHGTEIYIGQVYLDHLSAYSDTDSDALYLMLAHEFFHCMTRNNDDFRRDMYALIGTEIDSSITLDPAMRANILSNPDVERYDNYAVFDIEGVPTKCMIVTYVEDYQEGYGSFFEHISPALLPIETQDRFYMAADVPDFSNVVGENTGYVIAAEECMADNFSYAAVFGIEGYEGNGYATPGIIEGVLDRCAGK